MMDKEILAETLSTITIIIISILLGIFIHWITGFGLFLLVGSYQLIQWWAFFAVKKIN